ncbi:hypothetical protein IU433_16365 [Nocardia puris]|uniref:hypothetical protein n=1 Tax=Nocardia puris TaxID=208602 RepID=UPI001893ABEC|nr:hypothetical protein [Nocardia puris]MBF6211745.1 hypothetical protein [Nocardia puris]MBF6365748.1 hypothetical protein [Nocardia puris]MBF6460609.1 hypothetical protein [Nocardia puris]
MNPDHEPMLDLANGDIGMSRHLSKVLKIIADDISDKDLQNQINEVANGRQSLREFARGEAMMRLSDAYEPAIRENAANKTREEIEQLAELGEDILARYRADRFDSDSNSTIAAGQDIETDSKTKREVPDAASDASTISIGGDSLASEPFKPQNTIPGTRRPDRERIVVPEEPDDDDRYFQDRRARGWLE